MVNAAINKEADLNSYLNGNPPDSPDRTVAEHLLTVVTTFIRAQQLRIDADYNFRKDVDETDMLTQLETVAQAFKSWTIIRDEASAQAYLISMLGSKERREKKAIPPKKHNARKHSRPDQQLV